MTKERDLVAAETARSGSHAVDICATALDAAAIVRQQEMVRDVMAKVMKEGVHYGVIPGTKGKSLYQAGADVLDRMFRLQPTYTVMSATRNDSSVSFVVQCELVHGPSGTLIAAGIGSCNSRERKYANTLRKLAVRAAKKGEGPVSALELENTILKMASKRARVGACLAATGAGELFSADLEDDSELAEAMEPDEKKRAGRREAETADVDEVLAEKIRKTAAILDRAEKAGEDVSAGRAIVEDARRGEASVDDLRDVYEFAQQSLAERSAAKGE